MSEFDPASGIVADAMVDENDAIDQPGSLLTGAFFTAINKELRNLALLGGVVSAWGNINDCANGIVAYVAAQLAAKTNSANYFTDPCCRISQVAAVNLSTTRQYGAVDLVQAWVSAGTVSAGTIAQDTTGAAGGRTPYSSKLAGVSLGVNSALSWRKWLESRDAGDFVNGPGIVAVSVLQTTGAAIANATLTINKATAADNFTGVTLIGASGNLNLPNGVLTRISFFVANMGACANGIESILTVPTGAGAIVTKDFHTTDWQFSPTVTLAPFEIPKLNTDFIGVLRNFQPVGTDFFTGYAGASVAFTNTKSFCVPMRIAPAISTGTVVNNTNITSQSYQSTTAYGYSYQFTATAAGSYNSKITGSFADIRL